MPELFDGKNHDHEVVAVNRLWRVTVPHTLANTVEVMADSEEEAIKKAVVCYVEHGERHYRIGGWSSWVSEGNANYGRWNLPTFGEWAAANPDKLDPVPRIEPL